MANRVLKDLWYLTTPEFGLVITDVPEQYEGELTWSFPVRDPHFANIDNLDQWLASCARVGQRAMFDVRGEVKAVTRKKEVAKTKPAISHGPECPCAECREAF